MKKIVVLVGVVIVVALAAVLAVRFYPKLKSTAAPAGTAVEQAQSVANAAKPTELTEQQKKDLEEINKIPDAKVRQEQLIRFYRENNNPDQAITMLEDSMKSNPDPANWLPSAQLVECFLSKNDLVNAEKYLKNVMQDDQKASYALRTAAKFYAQKKDFAKATETLDKAMKNCEDDENRAFTYGSFAEMYLQQGDKGKARESLQKALKLAPKNEHFRQMLSQLDEAKAEPKAEAKAK